MNIYLINMLLELKNASLVQKKEIFFPYSRQNDNFIRMLYKQHIVQTYYVDKNLNQIVIRFKSYLNKYIFGDLKILSTPSKDKFLSAKEISRLPLQPKSTLIVSTDIGVITESVCKQLNKGGKALFFF